MPSRLLHRKRKKLVAALSAAAAAVVIAYMTPHMFKTPQNTSVLTGQAWVRELLAGHPRRFHNMLGMSKRVFFKLCIELHVHSGLCNTRHLSLEEQLAMFLYMCRTGGSH